MKPVSFSTIVSSAESVTGAFDSHPVARHWWSAILWLHGKPTSPHLPNEERQRILADGFRFYAQLYRFLGVLFWLVGILAWLAGVFPTSDAAFYWMGMSALTGGFLWFSSGLGFAGAWQLRQGHPAARALLCAFMVMIIAFLSAFVTLASAVGQLQMGYTVGVNLGILGAMWSLGIGSYLIEVLYLVGMGEIEAST